MKFIETITFFGNDVLIPVDRIKHITLSYKDNGYQIHIKSDDDIEHVECFGKDDEKARQRYKILMDELGVKHY